MFSHLALPGTRVVVPFRNKMRIGYILNKADAPHRETGIKEISLFPDESPLVSENMLKLIRWVSDYYAAPIGEVFFAALPNLFGNVKEIGRKRRLVKARNNLEDFPGKTAIELNPSQKKVFKGLSELLGEKNGGVAIIHGVTGSGKTEIYLKAMEQTMGAGKQVLVLVPEISLTPQLAGRIGSYFGKPVAVYHSGLPETVRLHEWQKIAAGEANIVIGTRSAVFAPLLNVGLIVVDEEHDHSYKQEESPRYNGKDTAIMRGKIEGVPVILGSATPSIESLANAKTGKYAYFRLLERHGGAVMPEIKIIDMRREPRSELLNPHLSIELLSEIKEALKNGKQSLLFLNRRGFANFFLCRDCGFIPECPNCRITLTFHKKAARLICHYCDYSEAAGDTCPKCRGIDVIPIGSGTEMIEDLIKEKFPSARIARFDRDSVTTEKKRRDILSKMISGEIDILIGTQMITKGHDFPNAILVGIISADQSIHFPDFRSSERTFQLITQVSGRSGRALHPGKVIIQTYSPGHIAIEAAAKMQLDAYVSFELKNRKELSYPPFTRIANIRVSGNKEEIVINESEKIARIIKRITGNGDKLKLLGPAPAPLSNMRGKTRWQMLIKSPSARLLSQTLASLKAYIDKTPPRGVQISIDVDPVSMM